MKNIRRFLGRLSGDESGGILVMSAVLMVGVLGMAAIVADMGDIYYSYNELQSATNAAALAGAGKLSVSGAQATSYAALYSAQTGDKNTYGNLTTITNYAATLGCVTGMVANGVPCIETGSGSNANAIRVTQTAKVPLFFAAIFGHRSATLTATATALIGSPSLIPQNIAVIIDTTASTQDADSSCHGSQLSCELGGVQTLLQGLRPCSADGCGTLSNGDYQNAVDRVSLFTFPELSNTGQQTDDTNCSGTNPSITPYTFPSPTGTTYTPGQNGQAAPTYQVTNFASNYQNVANGSGTGALNGSSGVVDAVGGKSGCAGMSDPGGEGTYYAGVLYAAQASLLAEQAADPGSQNVIIIVSDGAATSRQSQMSSSATNSGLYPSYKNECEQAVTAAGAIQAAGTTIYSVAYGSPSSGCTTDTGQFSSPCFTMQQMASPSSNGHSYFYSDDRNGDGNCPSGAKPSSISGIFGAILGNFGKSRLIPNNQFPSS